MKILLFIVSIAGLSTGYSQSNAQLQREIITLQAEVNAIRASSVMALAPFVSVDPNPQVGVRGPNITFTGVNIHIVSGSGATDDHNVDRGLGNLIIGYDEDPAQVGNPINVSERRGSHNLVLGRWNKWLNTSFGGIVAGDNNAILFGEGMAIGGKNNFVYGTCVAVGGIGNIAQWEQDPVTFETIYGNVVLGGQKSLNTVESTTSLFPPAP